MKHSKVKVSVTIAMLSSISFILMLLNFPLPPFPGFLLVDFSDVPALIAALIFGPIAGIVVEFLKNVMNYLFIGSPTGVPVGQIANFLAGILFVLPTYYVYQKLRTRKGMVFSLVAGTITMGIIMSILNYYVILPAYTWFLNAPAMGAEETRKLIVASIFPFNLLKGMMISVVFFLIFVRMRPWITQQSGL
ncbi:riboflavin transporter FmnP [Bacillus carboniphilus]|uniref:Riboflavin transporter n=1 Tax=Bacillus carboniphilus TaxID=86663 RepID=A0ABP3FPT9_9BACI